MTEHADGGTDVISDQTDLKPYFQLVRQTVAAQCPDYLRSDFDDICQDAFVRFWRKTGEEIEFPFAYARKVAYSATIDAIRKARARLNHTDPDTAPEAVVDNEATQVKSPESFVAGQELLTILQHCLQKLPQRRRQILLMYFRGLSFEEIKLATGEKAHTIRNEVYRGRQQLQGLLAERGLDYEVE